MTDTAEDRTKAMRARDQQDCACGHPRLSHASYNAAAVYVGVGLGQCGQTACCCALFVSGGHA